MRALIFTNGDPIPPGLARSWRHGGAVVIAADGGLKHALAAGVTPDAVVGDLDSLTGQDRDGLESRGVRFIVHPTRKDRTDLELAIRYALDEGATEIVIFGALGGRPDHSLANMLLLALPELRGAPARIVDARQTMQVIGSESQAWIEGRAGDTLSLIALSGDAEGVTIEGCAYPLNGGVLPFAETLGISNVLTEPVARVSVRQGVVLAIHIRGPERART
jgi:thiamine pyrophosphokinase